MSVHTDIVSYCWTELDRLATLTTFPGQYVTPYRIPPDAVPNGSDYVDGDYVDISLAKSVDPATVARFFREPYEWVPLPDGVDPGSTMKDLFDALFACDKVKFAHMDFESAALAKGVGLVKDLISSKPKMPGVDDVTPLADLASLHFEYWGNTDLRAAVFRGTMTDRTYDVLGVVGLTIPWFGSDPLSMPLALLEPIMAPTVKDDATIQFVLAKRPARGVMVQVPPSQKETDLPIVVMSLTPPTIELDGWNRQVIAPFDLGTSVTSGDNALNFKITLPRPSVKTRIEILKNGEVYYAESHEGGEWLAPITHSWSWNGYSNEGVYDTKVLWGNDLTARVVTVDPLGRETSATASLGSGRDKIRWIDVTVDRKAKTCVVCVHARFLNPSQIDLAKLSLDLPNVLGGLLPGLPGVPSLPSVPSIPGLTDGREVTEALAIPKTFDLAPNVFEKFKQGYVIDSIARHWSRCKKPPKATKEDPTKDRGREVPRSITIDGEDWDLHVSCKPREKDAFDMILAQDLTIGLDEAGLPDPLKADTKDNPGKRSCNLACLMEGLPIIDIDSDIVAPDVGAHELGHSVLRETKGVWISLTHKGTSTPGQQPVKAGDRSGFQEAMDSGMAIFGSPSPEYQSAPPVPSDADLLASLKAGKPMEVDVMLYHPKHSVKSKVTFRFICGVEEDALGLVWLGKTAFG